MKSMRKALLILLVAAMIFTSCACAKKAEINIDDPADPQGSVATPENNNAMTDDEQDENEPEYIAPNGNENAQEAVGTAGSILKTDYISDAQLTFTQLVEKYGPMTKASIIYFENLSYSFGERHGSYTWRAAVLDYESVNMDRTRYWWTDVEKSAIEAHGIVYPRTDAPYTYITDLQISDIFIMDDPNDVIKISELGDLPGFESEYSKENTAMSGRYCDIPYLTRFTSDEVDIEIYHNDPDQFDSDSKVEICNISQFYLVP